MNKPIFECSGCGHVARDPEKDLELLRKAGQRSCCPERKMQLLAPAVAVKPLEWVQHRNGSEAYRAADKFHPDGMIVTKHPETYETERMEKILSALSPQPPVTPEQAALVVADWIDSGMITANEIINAAGSVNITLESPARHWFSQILRALAEGKP